MLFNLLCLLPCLLFPVPNPVGVNFELLNEFFLKNNLKVKKVVSQQKFLKNMGIIERAEIISKKMKFTEQSNLYLRIKRLLKAII